MALNARKIQSTGGNRPQAEPLDPGSYPARVVQVISLGLQKQRPYKGEEKPPKPEIYVTYELGDEFMKDDDGNDIEDKPRWISETIPMNSLDADLAKSTKRYLALDPEMKYDGDWAEIPGTPCNVVLTQKKSAANDRIYNNVSDVSTMRAKEAAKAPELVNPPKVFDVDEPDMEIFWSLPEWLQERIKENLEYEGSDLEELVKAGRGQASEKEEKPKRQPKKKPEPEPEEDEDDGDDDW